MLIVLLSNLFIQLSAQNQDSLTALAYFEQAKILSKEKKFLTSDSIAREGIQLFLKLENWKKFVSGHRIVLMNGYYSENYDRAIPLIKEGLKKIPASEELQLAKMKYNLGYAFGNIGDVMTSVKYYEESVAKFEAAKDTAWMMSIYGNLGIRITQLGDYRKAIDYLEEAIVLSRTKKDTMTLWRGYINLAQAYFGNNNFSQAQSCYNNARQLYNEDDGRYEFHDASIQFALGKYNRALTLVQRAIQKTTAKYGDIPEAQCENLKLLGDIHLKKNEASEGLAMYQSILPIVKKGADKRELGKLYLDMADAHFLLKNYDLALQQNQLALNTFLPAFKNTDPKQSPDANVQSREIWLMEIFRNKGHCFLAKYHNAKEASTLLLLAEKHFQLAVDYMEGLKLNYDEIASVVDIGDHVHPFYEDLIAIKLLRFDIFGDQKFKQEAFEVAQRSTAFVLRELLNEKQALDIAGIPEDTLALLDDLQFEKVRLSQLIAGSSEMKKDSLQRLFFNIKQNQFALKRELEKKYPEYKQLRNDLEVVAVENLQEALDSSTALIKYFLGKQKLYIFSITESQFHVDHLTLSENFENLIDQYRRAISDLDFIIKSKSLAESQYLSSAYELYLQLLGKPLARIASSPNIKRLKIIGDGLINTIPFQALLTAKSDSWTEAENLLIKKYALSYAYFSKMLLTDYEFETDLPNTFTAFGLEFDKYTLDYLKSISKDSIQNKAIQQNLRAGGLTNLPFSDDEAKELAELMDGESWLNGQATKANFLKQAPRARILHTATHSIVDTEQSHLSALIFIKTRDSLDNLLRQETIYNMDLNADLIVLSACNTAYGKNDIGEGVNSLARAFNFSGIPSVLATSWSIADESSKNIMLRYYEYLKEGWPKDVAMQKTQLDYLQNDELSSPAFRIPIYWAAWKQIGDSRPLQIKPKKTWPIALVAVSLGILFLLFFLSKNILVKPG